MASEKTVISLFPLQGVVLFPGMNLPLFIFEERYKKMILSCLEKDKSFGVVFAKGNMCAEVGTRAEIIDVEKLEEGKMNILAEGKSRFKISKFISEEPYHEAEIQPYEDKEVDVDNKLKKALLEVKNLSSKALSIFDSISGEELSNKLTLPDDPNELLFLVAANLTCSLEIKQDILEIRSIKQRTNKIHNLLKEEIKRLEIVLKNKETQKDVIKNGKLEIS